MKRYVAVVLLCAVGVSPLLAASRSFLSNGVKIQYLDEGKGETLVLLHGSGGGYDDFAYSGVIRALRKDYRILAPDARAHGRSGHPREVERYGMEMIEDVVRLLDQVGVDQAHVLGFSMGARIAAKLMVTHPERLRSVILAGGGARRDTPQDRLNLEALARRWETGDIRIRAWPDDAPPATMEEARRLSDEALKGRHRLAIAALTRGRVAWYVSPDELRASQVPAIGIAGTRDGALAEVRRTAEAKPGMKVVEIEGAAHVETLSRKEFVAAIRAFLAAQR